EVSTRRVDEGDERTAEALREPHCSQRLAVALWQSLAAAPDRVAVAALEPDDHHAAAADLAQTSDHGRVVAVSTIAMQFDELRRDAADVVLGRRAVLPPSELDDIPGVLGIVGPGVDVRLRHLWDRAIGPVDYAQDHRERIAQPDPADDRVEEAVLHQELGRMRADRFGVALL